MKNFLKATLIGILIGTQAHAGLPPTTTKSQNGSAQTTFQIQAPNNQVTSLGGVKALLETGNTNLLANPNFQASTVTSGWATGGSGLSVTADATNYLDLGPQSALLTFTASTTGTFSQTITPTNIAQFSGVNMEASAWVKTTATTLQVCALVGGVATNCQAVPSAGTWQRVTANFIGPASGSFGIQIQTSASLTGTANAGFAYVGRATNLSQVSQAQDFGYIAWSGASCSWTNSTASSWQNFGANSNCTGAASGNASVPGSKIPAITFTSAAPGTYCFIGSGDFQKAGTTSDNIQWRFSDGTNATDSVQSGLTGATGALYVPHVQGCLKYSTPQSNLTVQLQSFTTVTTTTPIAGPSANGTPAVFSIQVLYFPSQSQTAYRADATPASWSGNSTLNATTTSTTFGVVNTTLTGAITPAGTPRNITCTAASSSLGVTCTVPRVGNYLACYSGWGYDNTSGAVLSTELVDGSGTVIVGQQQNASALAGGQNAPFGGCGNYTASSLSPTFQVYAKVSSNTGNVSPTSFSLVELDAPMSAPYLTGSVTSNTSGQERVERASWGGSGGSQSAPANCSSTPCTVYSQSGSWVTSVVRNSSGNYTVNFAAGEFSAPPDCVVQDTNFSGTSGTIELTGLTKTSLTMVFSGYGDSAASMICMGPR